MGRADRSIKNRSGLLYFKTKSMRASETSTAGTASRSVFSKGTDSEGTKQPVPGQPPNKSEGKEPSREGHSDASSGSKTNDEFKYVFTHNWTVEQTKDKFESSTANVKYRAKCSDKYCDKELEGKHRYARDKQPSSMKESGPSDMAGK